MAGGFPPEADVVALFNAHLGGFERAMGLQFTRISSDEVVAEVPVTPALLQPYGIVHGGVYASIVETLASAGAAVFAMRDGKTSVGLENTTSFVRAVRSGKLPTQGAELELIKTRCQICHTTEYLTQQRLSAPAWKQTIEKMRRFGALLSDAEVASLAAFAAKLWSPELPDRTWAAGPPPPGALPGTH